MIRNYMQIFISCIYYMIFIKSICIVRYVAEKSKNNKNLIFWYEQIFDCKRIEYVRSNIFSNEFPVKIENSRKPGFAMKSSRCGTKAAKIPDDSDLAQTIGSQRHAVLFSFLVTGLFILLQGFRSSFLFADVQHHNVFSSIAACFSSLCLSSVTLVTEYFP